MEMGEKDTGKSQMYCNNLHNTAESLKTEKE